MRDGDRVISFTNVYAVPRSVGRRWEQKRWLKKELKKLYPLLKIHVYDDAFPPSIEIALVERDSE